MGLASRLDERFFVVAARGPHTLRSGSYGWFHVNWTPEPEITPDEFEASRLLLPKFIDQVVEEYGVDADRVYLMGFSQGSIMSLALTLTGAFRPAGVVVMSGRLVPEAVPIYAAPDALAGIPIFVVHGTTDQTLGIHHGRSINETLSGLPVRLTYREYPMGHEVSSQSLADISAWLTAELDNGATAGA